jgi:hypothetical protein
VHYVFTTIIQSEEQVCEMILEINQIHQKRQQFQLMQMQQQMMGTSTPLGATGVTDVRYVPFNFYMNEIVHQKSPLKNYSYYTKVLTFYKTHLRMNSDHMQRVFRFT